MAVKCTQKMYGSLVCSLCTVMVVLPAVMMGERGVMLMMALHT